MRPMMILIIFSFFLFPAVYGATLGGGAGVDPGAGNAPQIEYSWTLPDDYPEEGTQLELYPGGERNDIYACIVVGDAEGRETIADVFVDVFHPDESFKFQVHSSLLEDHAEIQECIDDALASGLIDSQDAQDISYNIFNQPNWHMFKVFIPMYYHQPSGDYTVKAQATDSQSFLSDAYNTTFTWMPGTYLEFDFTSINFGGIQPGAWKRLDGDTDMSTPEMPTLSNQGNTEAKVGLEFSDFKGTGVEPNKVIDSFDAQLRNLGTDNYEEIPGEHLEFASYETVWFTYPLSLCRQEKIDFSIHADIGTPPDNYTGNLTLYVEPVITSSPPKDLNITIDAEADTSCSSDEDCSEGYCRVVENEGTCTGFSQEGESCTQDAECEGDLFCIIPENESVGTCALER